MKTLRTLLNCTLPIEFFYSEDVPANYLEKLNDIKDVKIIPLAEKFGDMKDAGWAIKPFCILASSFEEVILMDADVLFTQNPEIMFEMDGYKKTGSIFFHDRYINWGTQDGHHFTDFILSNLSPESEQVSWLKHETQYGMESGVVVVNKSSDSFFGLLATCAMNRKPERDYVYKFVHGMKFLIT